MLPSWRLARNALAGRPGRTALIIGVVTLASALIVSVSCTIESVQRNIEQRIVTLLGASDARIVHLFNGRVAEPLLEVVRSWPEVDLATGRVNTTLTLTRADGGVNPQTGRPRRATCTAIGVEWDLEQKFRDLDLRAGRWPTSMNEAVIDPIAAETFAAVIGDDLEIQRFGEPIQLRVVGVYDRPILGALQRPLIRLDRRIVAEAADLQGDLSRIAIILRDDVDIDEFCLRRQNDLPKSIAVEPAEMARAGFDERVRAGRLGLIVATILTFVGASFIIVTGMTTAVTERQRALAILRCLGATRGQLLASQVIAGLTMASIGMAAGIPLGVGLSWILLSWYHDLLTAGLFVSTTGIQLAVVGSLACGLAGAAYPAWLASRVSPLQAMTAQARPVAPAGQVVAVCVGLACVAAQIILAGIDDPDRRFWAYALAGIPLLLVGYFILNVPILAALTVTIGPVLSKIMRLPAGLVQRSILRTPYRHGLTAGTLMIGMSILISTWSSGESFVSDWLGQIRFADGFAFRTTGISQDQRTAIEQLPFVDEVCPIGYLQVPVPGRSMFGIDGLIQPFVICIGFEPKRFFEMNRIDWMQGDPNTAIPRLLEGDAILVAEQFLIARDVGVGARITLGVGDSQSEFEVVGVVSAAGLDIATQLFGIRNAYMKHAVSCVFMDFDAVARHFDSREAAILQVNLTDGISDSEAAERVMQAAPGVVFRSGREIHRLLDDLSITLLTVLSVVALGALVLASVAVGNVILATIHSRRFEYGVLRASGASRGLLARLLLTEAGLLAICGGVTGIVLGLHFARTDARNYESIMGIDLDPGIPVAPTIAGLAVMLLLTIAASLPGVAALVRTAPARLIAGGRND